MESISVSPELLRESNRQLDLFLDAIRPSQQPLAVSPEHMTAALGAVLRVGEWLRAGLAENASGSMAQELAKYRHRLEQLHQLLPDLQARLLLERARLQTERAHLEGAEQWARSTAHGE